MFKVTKTHTIYQTNLRYHTQVFLSTIKPSPATMQEIHHQPAAGMWVGEFINIISM